VRLRELEVTARTSWPPPALLIFLGFGGVSRVCCRLFPASKKSHGGEEDGGGEGEQYRSGELARERDEMAEISRLRVGGTALAARLTKENRLEEKPSSILILANK